MTSPHPVLSRARILVVEDELRTREILALYLGEAGYDVQSVHDGRSALDAVDERPPQLIVLDLMLPGMDGWEVCRRIRQTSDLPIIILSARQEEEDRLLGLGLGADDYVVKPFSPREIVLRVKAILRRTRSSAQPAHGSDSEWSHEPQTIGTGEVILDEERRSVSVRGQEVILTPSEYKLLTALMRRPNKTFARDELLNQLYPLGGQVVPKVIDVHIGKLRHKIETDPQHPTHVITVRGFGYRFAGDC
jgi:DNA-binding response OmpR family regulator